MTVAAPAYDVAPRLWSVDDRGRMAWRFHRYQRAAMRARERFVLVLAGTQSGKTSMGPAWLLREIIRCGPGDYLVVTPTFPLLEKKALPEFLALFREALRLGDYVGGSMRRFRLSADGARRLFGARWRADAPPTQVFFGHAQDADGLESATARAAWLDEAGQKKFKRASWEAILRRLSLFMGRVLLTTTPYYLGWLKSQLYDRAGSGDVAVVNFPSIANPSFPRAEFERARATMPEWRFRMFYLGQFTRPAGLIYDVFDPMAHVVPALTPPPTWRRVVGVDFGAVNTAALYAALNPADARWYVYREYRPNATLTSAEHATAMRRGESGLRVYGGAKSEAQQRADFTAGGLRVREPLVADVEAGIDRVYALIKADRLRVTADCRHLLDELAAYSRELGDDDEPTEKIEDKSDYHLLDALRYAAGAMTGGAPTGLHAGSAARDRVAA